jgi:hypothetical protein
MNTWKAFLDSLDTPGGHVFILLMLVVVSVGALAAEVPAAEPVAVAAGAALMVALRGQKRNNGD